MKRERITAAHRAKSLDVDAQTDKHVSSHDLSSQLAYKKLSQIEEEEEQKLAELEAKNIRNLQKIHSQPDPINKSIT